MHTFFEGWSAGYSEMSPNLLSAKRRRGGLYTADERAIVKDSEAWTDLFYGFQDDRVIDDIPEDTRYVSEKLLPPYKEVKSNTGKTVTDTAIQEDRVSESHRWTSASST
jgi:hypothetical protein